MRGLGARAQSVAPSLPVELRAPLGASLQEWQPHRGALGGQDPRAPRPGLWSALPARTFAAQSLPEGRTHGLLQLKLHV